MKKITIYILLAFLAWSCGTEENPNPIRESFFGEGEGGDGCRFSINDWEGLYVVSDPSHPYNINVYTSNVSFKKQSGEIYTFIIEDFGGYSDFGLSRNIEVEFMPDNENIVTTYHLFRQSLDSFLGKGL